MRQSQSVRLILTVTAGYGRSCEVAGCFDQCNPKVDMDITDFQGVFKFKLIIPSLYVLSWIAVFLGPSLFPVVYQRYCFGLWVFLLGKMLYLLFNTLVILVRTYHTLKGYQPPPLPTSEPSVGQHYQPLPVACDRFYAFVIPSYKEDVDLLADTLKWIASHSRSRTNYLVFMAMERHEEGSEAKAASIIDRFRGCFRMMEYTCHELREHEHRGKASNVSWCVEHLEPYLQKGGIPLDRLFVTVIDADSWVPPLYIDKVEEYLDMHIESEHISVFVPPQIFTRNYLDVPVFVRMYDHTHSFAQLSNMRSCLDLIMPISNYTLSYQLIKRIGFWDTCADAIGEDFHTTQKAFWKTGGEVKSVPIYTAFNQVNVSTGVSYWADIEARFWQAERHAQGVSDVAYSINQMIKTKLCGIRALTLVYYIFECFAVAATIPWAAYSIFYQNHFLYKLVKPSPELYMQEMLTSLMNMVSIATIICWVLFQIFKRNSNRILYQQQNESPLRMIEYPLIVMIDIIFIAVPVFVLATFGSLFKAKQYHTAEKVLKKDRPAEPAN